MVRLFLISTYTWPEDVQLVHSLILSHIDYCNALFYNLPEYLLHKLTKVLYSAMRFIFGLRGSALRMHMLPYLKSLHFLPVKFRIEFKIGLLTHKYLHGYAPTYLKNLINSRFVSERYSLHFNDDNWLLQTVTSLNFARSQSMFSCASPEVWNSLPLSLREIETLSLFKKRLKANKSNQIFHYTRCNTPKRVTSWRGPSARHCARATQLLSKKCRSGGEPLATLCPI